MNAFDSARSSPRKLSPNRHGNRARRPVRSQDLRDSTLCRWFITMKSPRSRISLAGCGCLLALALQAKASESAAQPARPDDPVQIETALIAKVHAAALQDGEADLTSLLASETPLREPRRVLSLLSLR